MYLSYLDSLSGKTGWCSHGGAFAQRSPRSNRFGPRKGRLQPSQAVTLPIHAQENYSAMVQRGREPLNASRSSFSCFFLVIARHPLPFPPFAFPPPCSSANHPIRRPPVLALALSISAWSAMAAAPPPLHALGLLDLPSEVIDVILLAGGDPRSLRAAALTCTALAAATARTALLWRSLLATSVDSARCPAPRRAGRPALSATGAARTATRWRLRPPSAV